VVLVARDVLVGKLPGFRIQDGFGDIPHPDAIGQRHIITVRAPRQQQRRDQQRENLLHTEIGAPFNREPQAENSMAHLSKSVANGDGRRK
jgi:hypothetical protein